MDNFNNNFYFDFSQGSNVGGQTYGDLTVDNEMSDTSMNPVANAIVKKYIDASKTTMTPIFANTDGKHSLISPNMLEGYDLIICYASACAESAPTSHCLPFRYLTDAASSPMALLVTDNEVYTRYMFTKNGFYIENYSGDSRGKVFALYGVKL